MFSKSLGKCIKRNGFADAEKNSFFLYFDINTSGEVSFFHFEPEPLIKSFSDKVVEYVATVENSKWLPATYKGIPVKSVAKMPLSIR